MIHFYIAPYVWSATADLALAAAFGYPVLYLYAERATTTNMPTSGAAHHLLAARGMSDIAVSALTGAADDDTIARAAARAVGWPYL